MGLIILLDANVVGLLASGRPRPGKPDQRTPCREWLGRWTSTPGADVFIPAIADYEVRREAERRGATAQLARLASLQSAAPVVPVSLAAWAKAAVFWAEVRRAGVPTAADDSLDGDAILAGVAATIGEPGDQVVVATANVKHLERFGVVAKPWGEIV